MSDNLSSRMVADLDRDPAREFIMDSLDLEGFDPQKVADEIRSGRAGCMVISDGDEPVATIVIHATEAGMEVRMGKAINHKMRQFFQRFQSHLEWLAREMGMEEIIIYGRPGFIRDPDLRKAGYRPRWSAVSKTVH